MLFDSTSKLLLCIFTLFSLPGHARDLVLCLSDVGVRVEVLAAGDKHDHDEFHQQQHVDDACRHDNCKHTTRKGCTDVRICGLSYAVSSPTVLPGIPTASIAHALPNTAFAFMQAEPPVITQLPPPGDGPPPYAVTILRTVVFLN